MPKTVITIGRTQSSVSTFGDSAHAEAVRERLKMLRASGLSDDAVLSRMKTYKRRYTAAKMDFSYASQIYIREVKLMLDAYSALAAERGLI